MRRKHRPDLPLLLLALILVFIGMMILASVSASFSRQKTGSTLFFLNHQLLFGLIPGFFLGAVAYALPLGFLKRLSPLALLAGLVAMGAVFLPFIGGESGGAARWIYLGPLSLQPSEPLKLAFILYLAAWLESRTEKKNSGKETPGLWQTFAPFLIILGAVALLLLLQPDMGTLIVLSAIAGIMYFIAKTPLWHTGAMIGAGVVTLLLLIKLVPYRFARLQVFLDPSHDPLGQGYQIKQALIAIGSGGIIGKGLGLSIQKFGFLPEPISDSIFAVFAEEAGFIGASVLILLFLAFVIRGYMISSSIEHRFAKLVTCGIISWIAIQAFVNMGALTGMLPLTGIPLPFVSYGGSALVSELIAMGILLNASRERKL